jgi:hypothetical protein
MLTLVHMVGRRVRGWPASALREPGRQPAGRAGSLGHGADLTGAPGTARLLAQESHELGTGAGRAFHDDLDPPVGEVGGVAGQPELQGARPDPPPQADALDPSGHPGRDPRDAR